MKDPAQRFRLDGRVAVVTGASSGMGVTFAQTLASAGARVVLAARREDRLEDVARGIRAAGGAALVVRCDVAREEEVDALVEKTRAAFGAVDVLVNNAGFTTVVPAEQQSLADWRAHIDVMLTGILSVRAALRSRHARGGQRQRDQRRLDARGGRFGASSPSRLRGGEGRAGRISRASWRRSGHGAGCA